MKVSWIEHYDNKNIDDGKILLIEVINCAIGSVDKYYDKISVVP